MNFPGTSSSDRLDENDHRWLRKGKTLTKSYPLHCLPHRLWGYFRGQPLPPLIILHPHQLPAREHEALSILIIPRFPADTHSRPKSSWTVVSPVVGGQCRKARVWNVYLKPTNFKHIQPWFVGNFWHLQRSWVAGEQGNDGSNSSWADVIVDVWMVGLWQGSHFDARVHVHRWDPGYPDPSLNPGYDAEIRHQSWGFMGYCTVQVPAQRRNTHFTDIFTSNLEPSSKQAVAVMSYDWISRRVNLDFATKFWWSCASPIFCNSTHLCPWHISCQAAIVFRRTTGDLLAHGTPIQRCVWRHQQNNSSQKVKSLPTMKDMFWTLSTSPDLPQESASALPLLHSRACLNTALLVDGQLWKNIIQLFQEILDTRPTLLVT